MTNATDAGKRLSAAELAEIAERHKLENVKGSNLWSTWYECNAQREKLLSHIAAITTNRGSVSKDRAGVIPARIVKLCESRPAFDWSNYREGLDLDDAIEFLKADFVALDEAADALAAIQQAMPECSGGACCEAGRIVFTLNEYRMANLVDALSQVPNNGDWWGETLNAISDGMKTINLHTLHSNGGRTFTQEQVEDHNISAIPLPPSPVKESRDAWQPIETAPWGEEIIVGREGHAWVVTLTEPETWKGHLRPWMTHWQPLPVPPTHQGGERK